MNLTPVHLGVIKDGKFLPDCPEFFKEDLRALEGLDIAVTVNVVRRTRSLELNKFYWGFVIRPMVEFFNREKTFQRVVTSEFIHELMKSKFLGTEKIPIAGEIIEKVNSSRSLSNADFKDYVDYIIAWANELFNIGLDWPAEKEEAA